MGTARERSPRQRRDAVVAVVVLLGALLGTAAWVATVPAAMDTAAARAAARRQGGGGAEGGATDALFLARGDGDVAAALPAAEPRVAGGSAAVEAPRAVAARARARGRPSVAAKTPPRRAAGHGHAPQNHRRRRPQA